MVEASEVRAALELRCGDRDYVKLAKPFLVTMSGETWTGATNGHGIVFVKGDYAEPREEFPDTDAVLAEQPKTWRTLRAGLIGELCPPPVDECDWCDGTGHNRPAKPHLEPSKCDQCGGLGVVVRLEPTEHLVELGGGCFNARLIRHYCALMPAAGAVEVGVSGSHDGHITLWFRWRGSEESPAQLVALRPMKREYVRKLDWLG